MKYFYEYNIEYNYYYLRFNEDVTLDNIKSAIYELMNDKNWKPGIRLLCDISKGSIDLSDFANDHYNIMNYYNELDNKKTSKMVIFVNTEQYFYYEDKMKKYHNYIPKFDIEVFCDYDYALLWLILD